MYLFRFYKPLVSGKHTVVEKSPEPSPEKVNAPLQVVSPNHSEPSVYSIPLPTTVHPTHGEKEQRTVVDEHIPAATQVCVVVPGNPEECLDAGEQGNETQGAAPAIASTSALQSTFTAQIMESLAAANSSQAASPRFSQYLPVDQQIDSFINDNLPLDRSTLVGDTNENFQACQFLSAELGTPSPPINNASINITRNEVIALTNVLSRIPQSFLSGENDLSPGLTVSVVEIPPGPNAEISPRYPTGTDRGDLQQGNTTEFDLDENPLRPSKRPRPRYCLNESMFRKHPVLKFSATGPIDKEKTPYKWWCRFCKIELSLMSRGPLEMISHYKTESHLIKKHRIRMETPGLALYDREEVQLQGVALQEAERTAKDTYPIPPQLGPRRLLVGQDTLPIIKGDSSLIEIVLTQLRILEFGLKHGGSLASLVGIYDEIQQHISTTNDFQPFNWESSRVFVSIYYSL